MTAQQRRQRARDILMRLNADALGVQVRPNAERPVSVQFVRALVEDARLLYALYCQAEDDYCRECDATCPHGKE